MLRKLLSQTQIYNHSLPKKGLIYDKQFATYAVMKSFLDGDVKKGELIGYINDFEESGHSYEHLHFAIRTGNVIDYYGYSEWEWRILGGHTIGNPVDVGWLHPSNFINEQNQIN